MFTILLEVGIIGSSKGLNVNIRRILKQLTAISFLGAIVVINNAFTNDGLVERKMPSSLKPKALIVRPSHLADQLRQSLYPKRGLGVDPFTDEMLPAIKSHVPGELRVMVIDTGIGENDLLSPYVRHSQGYDYVDNNGHGTHIAGIIAYGNQQGYKAFDPLCAQVRIFSCKFYEVTAPNSDNLKDSINCVKKALKLKIDVINYSAGGTLYSESEFQAYKRFTAKGGIAVTAAGNEYSNSETIPYYPANFRDQKHLENVYFVQNVANNGDLDKSSNVNPFGNAEYGDNTVSTLPHNQFGTMSGTSQAAAARTHRILKNACQLLNGAL